VVNIEQGIWWQQLLGPRVKKSKEREDSHSFSLILIENQMGRLLFYIDRGSHVKNGKRTRKMELGLFPFPFPFPFYFSFYIGSLKNFTTIIHEVRF
jgi:hypothetical protein